MSYSTPGPQRDEPLLPGLRKRPITNEVREQLARVRKRPPPADEPGEAHRARDDESSAGQSPPSFTRVFMHERRRVDARRVGDDRMADRALGMVVDELVGLLDRTAVDLRKTAKGGTRERVRQAVPRVVARAGVAGLPLGEVADLLGLPRDEVDVTLDLLKGQGGLTPPQRQQALSAVDALRTRLREAAEVKDHSLVDQLIRLIVRIAALVTLAVAAAPLGALAVADSVVDEVVKAGVIALVAVSLQSVAEVVQARREEHKPTRLAREAHEALLSELPVAESLNHDPAYRGEHAVVRLSLLVRCCAARVAMISLDWDDSPLYWQLLDDIEIAVNHPHPNTFAGLHRKLGALAPPER
jgi:hypothetical protein